MAKDKMKKKKKSSRVEEYMNNFKNSVTSKFSLDDLFNELEKSKSIRSKFSLEEIESEIHLHLGKSLDDFIDKYNIDYNATSFFNFRNHWWKKMQEYMNVEPQEIMTNAELRSTIKELIEIASDLLYLKRKIDDVIKMSKSKNDDMTYEKYTEIYYNVKPYEQLYKTFHPSYENVIKHYQEVSNLDEYTESITHNIIESQDWLVKHQKYIMKTKGQIKTDVMDLKLKLETKIHTFFERMEIIASSFYFYNKTTNQITKKDDSNAIRGYDTKTYLDILANIVKQPVRYDLSKSDLTIIKSSAERLEDFFNYKAI